MISPHSLPIYSRTMKTNPGRLCSPLLALVFSLLPALSAAQSNNTALSTLIPQLQDLQRFPSPNLGPGAHQNLTYCCLQAVDQFFTIGDGGTLEYNKSQSGVTIKNTSPGEFIAASRSGRFPCTSVYDGNNNGAPDVLVTHSFCYNTCGRGWTPSASFQQGGWLTALFGFIVPAIIFCLNIPRRRKLEIPTFLFGKNTNGLLDWARMPFGLALAAILAATDIIIWISICLAISGPALASAALEAFLDKRVISFLTASWKSAGGGDPGLTLDMRVRLLYTILIGNLDLNVRRPFNPNYPLLNHESRYLTDDSPLYDIEKMIYPLRLYDSDDESYHPRQRVSSEPSATQIPHQSSTTPTSLGQTLQLPKSPHAQQQSSSSSASSSTYSADQITLPNPPRPNTPIPLTDPVKQARFEQTETQLRTMLECQYSFGATVGAPVVFFMVAFIYTLLDIRTNFGDEDTSLSLAFGMWWMIIPHVAILSGLLLAGNNPNTLEGVIGRKTLEDEKEPICLVRFGMFKLITLQLAYPSRYKVQWLWLRGESKREYLNQILKIYGEDQRSPELERLKDAIKISVGDWMTIIGFAVLLLFVPFILAFLTAYFTPTVGISCRSLTFLIYISVQLLQMALHLKGSPRWVKKDARAQAKYVGWHIAAVFLGAISVFTAVGGTIMQLTGAYDECICKVSAKYWLNLDDPNVQIELSRNSLKDITNAQRFWQPLAIVGICALGTVTYVAWWWQRRQRDNFHEVIKNLKTGVREE